MIKKLVGLVFLVGSLVAFSLFGSRVSTDNILALSIQKNFCALHKNKKECRYFHPKEFAFTLHGLWPQPRSRQNCSNRYKRLPKDIWDELKVVMPGAVSGLAKHEWRKHGSCYGKDEKAYFKDAIKLVNEVNNSALKDFFAKNSGQIITKQQLNQAVKKAFGNVARKVQMVCKRGLVTEVRFSLKGRGDKKSLKELLEDAKPLRSGCQRGRI